MNHRNHRLSVTASALGFAVLTVALSAALVGSLADAPYALRPMIGDFTGEVVPAGPVYRLSTLEIVGHRGVDVADGAPTEAAASAGSFGCAAETPLSLIAREVA